MSTFIRGPKSGSCLKKVINRGCEVNRDKTEHHSVNKMTRGRIPVHTKQAIIAAVDRGDSRRTIKEQYQLKNYSNINRILGQRDALEEMIRTNNDFIENMLQRDDVEDSIEDGDEEDMSEDSENESGGEAIVPTIFQEKLEKIDLGVKILQEILDVLSEKVKEVSNELASVENFLIDIEDDDGYTTDTDEKNSEDEDEDETDQVGGSDDDDDVDRILKKHAYKLFGQVTMLNNAAKTFRENLSNVTDDALDLMRTAHLVPLDEENVFMDD